MAAAAGGVEGSDAGWVFVVEVKGEEEGAVYLFVLRDAGWWLCSVGKARRAKVGTVAS